MKNLPDFLQPEILPYASIEIVRVDGTVETHTPLVRAMAAVLNVPPTALEAAAPTHYLDWDQPGRGKAPAVCGTYVRRIEHANAPSCPECRAILAARDDGKSADDTFGPPSVGTQVSTPDFDPTGGRARRER